MNGLKIVQLYSDFLSVYLNSEPDGSSLPLSLGQSIAPTDLSRTVNTVGTT